MFLLGWADKCSCSGGRITVPVRMGEEMFLLGWADKCSCSDERRNVPIATLINYTRRQGGTVFFIKHVVAPVL